LKFDQKQLFLGKLSSTYNLPYISTTNVIAIYKIYPVDVLIAFSRAVIFQAADILAKEGISAEVFLLAITSTVLLYQIPLFSHGGHHNFLMV